VDAITLTNELEQRGELDEIGGRVRLHELARLVPATANARHYAEIVRETATLRGLILAGGQIAQLGWDREGEPTELVARAEQLVFELGERRAEGELVLFKDALLEAFQTINKLYESGAEVTGLASGFKDLDRITGGFQPANLVIIAARPSMGKSAFALEIANHVAVDHETPCAFFSLEMSKQEVAQRLICSRGKVDAGHIRTGRLTRDDWPRVVQACGQLESAPLYVDDTPALSLLELRARAQTLKRRQPDLGLVVVDYLQLMTTGRNEESRVQEVSSISRGLKEIAKDLDLPVVALSQLNRSPEQRHDKRPMLSDLRESGSIEQDADLVMFLYREEYYDRDDADDSKKGVAEVIVAKHRNGRWAPSTSPSSASSPSSPVLPTSRTEKCLGCGREFETEQVVLLGQTFPAERYCELCRATEQVVDEQRRADERWARVQVPSAYDGSTFENFEPVPDTRNAIAVCRQWTKEFRAGTDLRQGLLLRGNPGAGKTHLAVALLREVIWSDREPRPTALFLNVPNWLNALRESYGDGEPPPNPSGYELVVLDDLGAEDWSSWARDRIYNLVNQREQQRRLVIVTTNHEWRELAGRVGGPTASRLRRLTREVHVDARTDFRERAAA
jgi:replicative DNA helicase